MFWKLSKFFISFNGTVLVYCQFTEAAVHTKVSQASIEMKAQSNFA